MYGSYLATAIGTTVIVGPKASQTENLVKELTFHWNGDMKLTPDVDNFVDTSVHPAVNRNFDGNYDAWENMSNAWGTQWGSWENTGAANVVSTQTQELNTFGRNSSGSGTSNNSLFTKFDNLSEIDRLLIFIYFSFILTKNPICLFT